MNQRFSTSEVARILGVTPPRVRAIVQAGLCQPERRGHKLEFSFQDLVVLRAAQGLLTAAVPASRVRRALRELKAQLPPERPLSGLRIFADGKQVVVRDGDSVWTPESRQTVLTFEVDELARRASSSDRASVSPEAPAAARSSQLRSAPEPVAESSRAAWLAAESAADWYQRGLELESEDQAAARSAYQKAVELDPSMSDAYVNLGRIAHENGGLGEAVRLYHLALERAPEDPIIHYNLAVALEDMKRFEPALSHYDRALELDPGFADAHYNLGCLLERLGRRAQALRHLQAYRALTRS